jgi:hypothetical protein
MSGFETSIPSNQCRKFCRCVRGIDSCFIWFEANKDAVEAPDGLSKEVKTIDPYSPVSNVTGA